jgi:hypothetical protein
VAAERERKKVVRGEFFVLKHEDFTLKKNEIVIAPTVRGQIVKLQKPSNLSILKFTFPCLTRMKTIM